MCGIAAAIGHLDATMLDAVRRASLCQRLRGPDAEGEWASGPPENLSRGGAFLAFRRLAIIDLSPEANQPMIDPVTGNALIFNGEIYNFGELRRELESLGDRFNTQGDSEVILRAYARWGAACLERLRGMFGLVIWDAKRRSALAARDRLGIKPLYYTRVQRPTGPVVLVASTLRALLATGLVERRLDPIGVSTYVWNGFVVGPGTIVRDVHVLSGGSSLEITADGAAREFRYWTLPERPEPATAEAVTGRLREAISQHLISDVPLGVFLSGGKDSSAIAALATKVSPRAVKTFNVAFDEAEYDESPYAHRVADALKTEHTEVRVTQRVFKDQLDDALAGLDQPTFDAINTYLVSRAVREAGITVAMAGTGGDELFGGYRTFEVLPAVRRWSRRLGFVPDAVARPVAQAIARARMASLASFPPQTSWGRLADALATRGDLVDLYQVAYGLFTADLARELDAHRSNGSTRSGLPGERAAELERAVAERSELHAISALELQLYIGERLLRDTDAASMEVSLEVRVPLLDHLVVESLFGLDETRRFAPIRSKALLSQIALEELPSSLFDRPKRGFELPLECWCKQGLSGRVGETLLDRKRCASAGLNPDAVARLWRAYSANTPGMYWSRVWAIYVLLWWCERHSVAA